MKRIYRSIIHELYRGEYEWLLLSLEQEERQRQRGRDLAKLRPWERGWIGKIEKQISSTMTIGRFLGRQAGVHDRLACQAECLGRVVRRPR